MTSVKDDDQKKGPKPGSRMRALNAGFGLMSCIAIGVAASSGGCLNRPIEPVEPRTTSTIVERITQTGVDKIDILLAIDNSSSMADKQQILAAAVPDLVDRLVNPLCVDKMGTPQPSQPSTPTADCNTAAGFDREFPPVLDINIGIVDSSLGGDGSDACPETGSGSTNRNNNDQGHLVTRGQSGPAMTYQNKGFLAWDPSNKRGGLTDPAALTSGLKDLVIGTGQVGCGYEHQLESVVRFLVDPNPYGSLVKGTGGIPPVTPMGTDQVVLQQRADFLRANSLLAIIMLTDENDCSINTLGPQNYAVLNGGAPFFRGASVCATNPNDKCCYSCGLPAPQGCTADPICASNPKLDVAADHVNLKCWNQKKRYGFDALFPVKRYINAFSQTSIDPSQADLSVKTGSKTAVQNPLFTDLSGKGQPVRDVGLVYFAGIVGVPYQAIAVDPTDLSKGFKTFDDLTKADFFTQYVGDPDTHTEPTNPIMIEDYNKRGVPAGSPNGGDRSISTTAPADLQYACIADLPMSNQGGLDCAAGSTEPDNPLCTGGSSGAAAEPQIKFKGYPCLRELAVIHGLAGQGITASICPQNSTDPSKANYGYRPAVGSIIDRLKSKLGGQCLPRKLNADNKGDVPCIVLEASHQGGQADCTQTPGRQAVSTDHQQAVAAAKADPLAPTGAGAWDSFCEIIQLPGDPNVTGTPKQQCQNTPDPTPQGLDGWCYIDAAASPQVGNPAIVAKCPPNEQRLVRFVGRGAVQSGATALITCSGDTAQ